MPTDQRHPLGVTDTPEPRSARQTINEMLDAGLLDGLMDRVDAGELTLTGEGGFLPEMVKAVLERGLAAELTEHLGYEKGDPAGRGSPNSRNGRGGWPPRPRTSTWVSSPRSRSPGKTDLALSGRALVFPARRHRARARRCAR